MTTTTSRRAKQELEVPAHPLADLIPDPEIAKRYKHRTWKGTEYNDFVILDYAQTTGKNVLTYADTGTGKTMMFMAYAAAHNMPIVTIVGNGGVDPNSFWGGWQPDPATGGQTVHWVDTDVTQAIRHGNCVLLIDEINYMPPKTLGVFNPLLDKRRFVKILELGNLQVPAGPNLLIAASMNRDGGYEGTRKMNKALMNRFPIKFHVDYDATVEKKLVNMSILLEIAGKLRAARKAGDLETPVSTNMLEEFETFTVDLGLDFAIENFLAAFEVDEIEAVKAVFEMHRADLDDQSEILIGESELVND